MTLKAKWLDRGYNPRCAPDPRYPDGIDIDLAGDKTPSCTRKLKHPTKRCGYWLIICSKCTQNALITTAGRPDDPRSITLACNKEMKT